MINKSIASLLISFMFVALFNANSEVLEDTDIEKYLNKKGFAPVNLESARDNYYKIVKQAKKKQETREDATVNVTRQNLNDLGGNQSVNQIDELENSSLQKTSQIIDEGKTSVIIQSNLDENGNPVNAEKDKNKDEENGLSIMRASLISFFVLAASL